MAQMPVERSALAKRVGLGWREQPALQVVGPQLAHAFHFRLMLDSLGDHLTATAVGDIDDRAHEAPLERVGMDTTDEMTVDLDEVRLHRRPQLEAGIALPEIIQRDGEAHRLIMADGFPHQRRIQPRRLLGQLDHHLMRTQAEAPQQATRQAGRVGAIQQHIGRHVDEQPLRQAQRRPLLERTLATQAVELHQAAVLARRREHRQR